MDEHTNETSLIDIPTSIPHCSNSPGIEIVWESDDNNNTNDCLFHTPRQWISGFNQTDLLSPNCNKYQISCQKNQFDLVIIIDSQKEYNLLIQTFLHVFLSLIHPQNHRLSLVILSSTNTDTFQYHLPLTSFNQLTNQMLDNYFIYTDQEYQTIHSFHQHFERINDYLRTNQQQQSSSQSIILTISSRLNFNENSIQQYPNIRYMTLDPKFQIDDNPLFSSQRMSRLRSLTSQPYSSNLFWTYSANRDLTFHTIFRFIESLCGNLR